MNRIKRLITAILAAAAALIMAAPALAITPQEILRKLDENNQIDTAYMEMSMIIKSGSRQMTKSMKVWAQGGDNAMAEFTNPSDKGTKYLKLGSEMWIYSPDAEEVVKLSGHMLKQGMAGSDFSYQDALQEESLEDLYNVTLAGEEQKDGRDCYVLELVAKPGKEVSYYREKLWITKAEFAAVHEELYAQSGKLLKVFAAAKVEKVGRRYYVTEGTMTDLLKKNSSTKLVISQIRFDVAIPAGTFSLQQLTK